MADEVINTAVNPLSLLQALIGGSKELDQTSTSTETGTNNTAQTTNQTQTQTGSNVTNTTGTQQQAGTVDINSLVEALTKSLTSSQGVVSGTSATTGTNTTNINEQTKSTADIAGLQQILQQQLAGPTPESLAAIFQQGAEAVPSLIAATANAVGARSAANTPTATALNLLNSKLVQQAALLKQTMLADASNTAGRIAAATGEQTRTGTNTTDVNQTTNTNQTNNQTQSTTSNTSTTSQQQQLTDMLTTIANQAINNTNNSTLLSGQTNTNQTSNVTKDASLSSDETTTINDDRLMKMLGGFGIYDLLQGVGGSGSLLPSGAGGGGTSGSAIINLLKSLMGGGTDGSGLNVNYDTVAQEWLDSLGTPSLTGDPLNPASGGLSLEQELLNLFSPTGSDPFGGAFNYVNWADPQLDDMNFWGDPDPQP